MTGGHELIYGERNGNLEDNGIRFSSESRFMRMINRTLAPLVRRVDNQYLTADAHLPDGSWVNITGPPVVVDGPAVTILGETEPTGLRAVFSPRLENAVYKLEGTIFGT